MTAGSPPFEILTRGDVDVVRLREPKMAYPTLEDLRQALTQRIDDGGRKIVVNLAPVAFLDSFGIGVIVAASRQLSKVGGQLKLCGIGERVRMSLTITRLDRTLDIVDDEEAAVRSLLGEA